MCLNALERRLITPKYFELLRYQKYIEKVPKERLKTLFKKLMSHESKDSKFLMIELFDSIPLDDNSPFDSKFIFDVISATVPSDESQDTMRGYHWKNVCQNLIKWDKSFIIPLFDLLLTKMRDHYRLTYDSDVQSLANELVKLNPQKAWEVTKLHFEETLPKWRSDLLDWMKGGLTTFDENESRGAIADLPLHDIIEWIDKDPESRAGLIAHAAPRTLDDTNGGKITRELLKKYGKYSGVHSGISATFKSGGWSGPTSIHLKRKRDKFRRWLGAGFELEVIQWIEHEIEYLDRDIEREEINEERSRFD